MSNEYTPTTEEVRTDYVLAYTEAESSQLLAGLAFDRWLAAHDAEVAAKARRDHRTEWADYINNWEATVGAPMCTPATIAHALRMNPTPFGRAAGTGEKP